MDWKACVHVCRGGLDNAFNFQANYQVSLWRDPQMYTRPVGLAFQGGTPLISCLMGGQGDEGSSIFYLPYSGVQEGDRRLIFPLLICIIYFILVFSLAFSVLGSCPLAYLLPPYWSPRVAGEDVLSVSLSAGTWHITPLAPTSQLPLLLPLFLFIRFVGIFRQLLSPVLHSFFFFLPLFSF